MRIRVGTRAFTAAGWKPFRSGLLTAARGRMIALRYENTARRAVEETMQNVKLTDMIGKQVFVRMLAGSDLQKVKLIGVDRWGIWAESGELTALLLEAAKAQALPHTAVVFLPYVQIAVMMAVTDSPSLNEDTFMGGT